MHRAFQRGEVNRYIESAQKWKNQVENVSGLRMTREIKMRMGSVSLFAALALGFQVPDEDVMDGDGILSLFTSDIRIVRIRRWEPLAGRGILSSVSAS